MVAEVILNNNAKELNRIFDYNIPENLKETVKIGSRVWVSFGRIKTLEEGFVVGIKEMSEYKVKDIAKIEESKLSENQISLANWMAKRYFCNRAETIKLMLPPRNYYKKAPK